MKHIRRIHNEEIIKNSDSQILLIFWWIGKFERKLTFQFLSSFILDLNTIIRSSSTFYVLISSKFYVYIALNIYYKLLSMMVIILSITRLSFLIMNFLICSIQPSPESRMKAFLWIKNTIYLNSMQISFYSRKIVRFLCLRYIND